MEAADGTAMFQQHQHQQQQRQPEPADEKKEQQKERRCVSSCWLVAGIYVSTTAAYVSVGAALFSQLASKSALDAVLFSLMLFTHHTTADDDDDDSTALLWSQKGFAAAVSVYLLAGLTLGSLCIYLVCDLRPPSPSHTPTASPAHHPLPPPTEKRTASHQEQDEEDEEEEEEERQSQRMTFIVSTKM